MKNLKQLSAITLCTLFATMQVTLASIDTGLGIGNGGATIINGGAGYDSITGQGTNNVGLNFNANSHVKWDTLNINSGETLNFNAVNGAKNLTILNTVQNNMSKIYGNIRTNNGIGKLIISNPNGMLYDGAKFSTAGDVMLTTKDMSNVDVNNITDGSYTKLRSSDWVQNGSSATEDLIQVQIKDSDFAVGGDFNIYAPKIVGSNSTIGANTFKLITANGADYLANIPAENKVVTKLSAMNIDGDVVVTNDVGAFVIDNGGAITGDLTANTGGWVRINESPNGNILDIDGNVNVKGHGEELILRHSDIGGNVELTNDGGFVDLGNVDVDGNVKLTTKNFEPLSSNRFNHYVHVLGTTNIDGNLDIESSQNIHIGNYDFSTKQLLPGKLTVGGDIKAHTTAGHITTTIDTEAKNVDFNAEKYNDGTRNYGGNILSDGKAVIKADTYKFKSAGYIGGLKETNGHSVDAQIIDVMENYTFIPADIDSHDYLTLNGGTITKLETPQKSAGGNDVQTYIKLNNDLLVTGANAGIVNLVAPDKKITITGDNVKADLINVDGRTGTLQLDFPKRNFVTKYRNIRDNEIKTIGKNEEITYELTNAPNGYNSPDFQQTDNTNTTYLVGPGYIPDPPGPDPDPNPKPQPTPPDDDNVRIKNWVPEDPMQPLVSTPVAFAADLDDDDIEGPCRKNVDGSVTVVRAYPMNN